MTPRDASSLAWDKMGGLIPAVVQHAWTGQVLMVGYMNAEALDATLESGFVTFYSRSKERIWRKGETSGNRLSLVSVQADCDGDALLIAARPEGPTCHLGTGSCFATEAGGIAWLDRLSGIVRERAAADAGESYTARLLSEGIARIAQKVGEEGVEVALAAVTRDAEGCVEETADLIYHLTVLLEARGFGWPDVVAALRERHEG
ncbi:bifunctional phosphoribosyl-AMP cyclohydrolase/phosphoribosyl-ATP diphosphatase HisIE [Allosphingosinicella flava]|uniref:Histidine biosynthesis bifunctional protein HisIE n=2 Tax=Allosphingosinicella flava TaxID=2771430 RepID=A0A7T2GM34_9SPHN|nr:bifunctional phosphoribosyl-AMP cyclohydrolase/phosphoribosyl-ATP diphosphatase HisIE [Sphingosinicella flava]